MKTMKAVKKSLMGMGGAALVVAVLATGCGDENDPASLAARGEMTSGQCLESYMAEDLSMGEYLDCVAAAN